MTQVPLLEYVVHWHNVRAESEDLLKQHSEAREAVEKVHNVLSGIASLAGCTPKKTGESEEWVRMVHRAESD
jgi:hypothetical protein